MTLRNKAAAPQDLARNGPFTLWYDSVQRRHILEVDSGIYLALPPTRMRALKRLLGMDQAGKVVPIRT